MSLFASAGVIGALSGIAARGAELSTAARWTLGGAFVFLALGALGGLAVVFPVRAPVVLTGLLRETFESKAEMEAPREAHLARASRARIGMIDGARRVNERKAWILRAAVAAAFVGVILLLTTVLLTLTRDLPAPGDTGGTATPTASVIPSAPATPSTPATP